MTLADEASAFFRDLQSRTCERLEALDGRGRFGADSWSHEGGGGGITRVLSQGAVFEKAGVGWSDVSSELPDDLTPSGHVEAHAFRATGMSLILHPCSPMVPALHANFRFLERGSTCWFGGGVDLTPYYPFREDVIHFHRTLKNACDPHGPRHYARFKKWCDEYFFLPHRGETRGVGGIFFDDLGGNELDLRGHFDFVRAASEAFLPAYVPIVERRRQESYGEKERSFQLWRRGRYVEFNLLYDRGTMFGLKTKGRVESVLMSMPPLVRWPYDEKPAPGTREAELAAYLCPTDWLGADPLPVVRGS
ncbi:MAG: oxygen-dependent coproporphyrinogen oxidase [Deltaproteobacteria bacterium]|nr:oxygen-dependent coproporphyrinogen oxidase [Deltaproteobacteria bacterium]